MGDENIAMTRSKATKKRPYRLNPKYKEKVRQQLENVCRRYNFSYEESEWISPMAVKDKKTIGICIFVDLSNLNDACVHGPFPTPLIDEILENVRGTKV